MSATVAARRAWSWWTAPARLGRTAPISTSATMATGRSPSPAAVPSAAAAVISAGGAARRARSRWTAPTRLGRAAYISVGDNGSGTLSIVHGGRVNSTAGFIGSAFGSGLATVEGSGSTWAVSGMYVGRLGSGTLSISGGGSVSCAETASWAIQAAQWAS